MGEWQPIETAPKDGSPVLVYIPAGIPLETEDEPLMYVCHFERWANGAEVWKEHDGDRHYTYHPTHWMPLPEPPKT